MWRRTSLFLAGPTSFNFTKGDPTIVTGLETRTPTSISPKDALDDEKVGRAFDETAIGKKRKSDQENAEREKWTELTDKKGIVRRDSRVRSFDTKVTSVGRLNAESGSTAASVVRSLLPEASTQLPIVGDSIKRIKEGQEGLIPSIFAKDLGTPQEILDTRTHALQPPEGALLARVPPRAINTTFGTEDRNPRELAFKMEERRLQQHQKNFDDMVVFEGGAIADHTSYGDSMIYRDFIHFGMYHHKWGYVPRMWGKYKDLLTSSFHEPVPFASLRSEKDYETYVGYINQASPLWTSPSVIFQPYYGWVIAEYFVQTMRSKFDPAEPLIIYDIGCGGGSFALSVLDFLADQYPEVYDRMEYHCIDMVPHTIQGLRNKLVNHLHRAKIHHISIHNWRELEHRRCFCLAIELLQQMPHDMMYHTGDGDCHEAWLKFAEKDSLATYEHRNIPLSDPLILRYIRYLRIMKEKSFHALKVMCMTDGKEIIEKPRWRKLEPEPYDSFFTYFQKEFTTHNPWQTMYVPTASMVMMEVLAQYFPRHHAMFIDAEVLSACYTGKNGPKCNIKMRVGKDMFFKRRQKDITMMNGNTDIAFPTNFDDLTEVYRNINGQHKEITCMNHPTFWRNFGGDKVGLFTAHDGFNPLLDDFKSYAVFCSHHPAEM